MLSRTCLIWLSVFLLVLISVSIQFGYLTLLISASRGGVICCLRFSSQTFLLLVNFNG
ncbi:hypothetical protein D0Y65_050177 [Glycine soja]|uniref:Uncharacterized protein n=1 Tax=Glycine soja TaxID=3848 RepID=A0A445FB23_GLYSO|nr:hypothetical protein D0Y65_050177 [Glycine soja]RZB46034.1 hypothetical protein D0Y65_050177 [Glycine soja]RZB46035.1 hypothetical protein D0Y65_050177 [Glycine soja]RZB46036.1 hypothetical protein D0Y65_050177 [Glycine soja]